MPDTSAKVPALKGSEAEDAILKYLKRVNRPYGAADVSANLKGAVTKPATQKVLAALADKGLITQKAYGKTNIYLARQDELEDMPPEKLQQLTAEHEQLVNQLKARSAEAKTAMQELSKLRGTPTDTELSGAITNAISELARLDTRLAGLRTGVAPVSDEELAALDGEWTRARNEWIRRGKIFKEVWYTLTETMTPQEARDLEETLGIEHDVEELAAVEKRVV